MMALTWMERPPWMVGATVRGCGNLRHGGYAIAGLGDPVFRAQKMLSVGETASRKQHWSTLFREFSLTHCQGSSSGPARLWRRPEVFLGVLLTRFTGSD